MWRVSSQSLLAAIASNVLLLSADGIPEGLEEVLLSFNERIKGFKGCEDQPVNRRIISMILHRALFSQARVQKWAEVPYNDFLYDANHSVPLNLVKLEQYIVADVIARSKACERESISPDPTPAPP